MMTVLAARVPLTSKRRGESEKKRKQTKIERGSLCKVGKIGFSIYTVLVKFCLLHTYSGWFLLIGSFDHA